jgi:[ribosomal protein S5]-alanine N-acetyltransferase
VGKGPYRDSSTAVAVVERTAVTTDWRRGLPVLTAAHVTLRELLPSDAPTMLAMMTTDEVARFISPPPRTLEGFEHFIAWTQAEREAGRYVCFAVVPKGMEHAVGLIQVRRLEPGFRVAEWGFAIGSPFWGSGIFMESAQLVIDFAFDEVGVIRLEARAALQNGRGNGALRKLGARPEAVLRKSFVRNGQAIDQQLWAILVDDWTGMTSDIVLQLH